MSLPRAPRLSLGSLRTRFSLLTAGVVALVILVVGLIFYVSVSLRLSADVDDRLIRRAEAVQQGIGGGRVFEPPRSASPPAFLGGPSPDSMFVVVHLDGGGDLAVLSDQRVQVPAIPSGRWAAAGDQPALFSASAGGRDFRIATVRLARPVGVTGPSGVGTVSVVAIGQSLDNLDATLGTLRTVLLATVAAGLLLALLAGWLAGRRAVRPIVALAGDVGRAGHAGTGDRVPVPAHPDEVRLLAESFNDALARTESAYRNLEALLEQQERFVADASHELRTPLTTIRTDIEVLRRHPSLPETERAQVLDSSLDELRRLSRLVTDLLSLARARTGVVGAAEPLDWDALLSEAVASARDLVAPRPLHSAIEPLGAGTGAPDVVRRLLAILSENIAQHTPEACSVWITARRDDGGAVIDVDDSGPGVPREALPHLLERFYQADTSRHTTGAGLGLAIADSLSRAVGGALTVDVSPHGGLRARLALPLTAPETRAALPMPEQPQTPQASPAAGASG